MNKQPLLSRLERSITTAFLSGQTARGVWINGCQQAQTITRMDISAPMLMFPIIGLKRVVADRQTYVAHPGQVLMLPKGVRCDVENIPDRGQSRFLGASLVFDRQTMDLFGKVYSDGQKDWDPKWKAAGSEELFAIVADWITHDQTYPSDLTQTRHRLVEILLILARQGLAGNLLISGGETLSERITQHFRTDLSYDWSMKDLTRILAVSERTLRRRLQSENTGFRDLLEDTRLNQGVERVISSDMPIGQIAFECGYQSQSRFAERFRLRFSMSPTELRATQGRPMGELVTLNPQRARN